MTVCPPPHVLLRVGIILVIFVSAARRFCSPTFAGFLLVAVAAEARNCAVHVLLILLLLCYVISRKLLVTMYLYHCFEVILHFDTGCFWCNDEPMRWRICCNSILRDFTTRSCRSVPFRCDDEKYVSVSSHQPSDALHSSKVCRQIACIFLLRWFKLFTSFVVQQHCFSMIDPCCCIRIFVSLFRNFKFSF